MTVTLRNAPTLRRNLFLQQITKASPLMIIFQEDSRDSRPAQDNTQKTRGKNSNKKCNRHNSAQDIHSSFFGVLWCLYVTKIPSARKRKAHARSKAKTPAKRAERGGNEIVVPG